ncbi:MAG TPA: hypothetical protein VFU99_00130 [Gaiellaceae bacterium]|nr:hypothetical protein [Gaiellaceae bacterium]
MKRILVVAASVAAFAAAGASGALAGEVKGPPGSPDTAQPGGNPDKTGAYTNSNSACSASGLNDYDTLEGQNATHTQTVADAHKYYGLEPGINGRAGLCRGGTNHNRDK